MTHPAVQAHEHGTLLHVKIVPGSSKTIVVGLYGDKLKIKVAAPPEKGQANQCLCTYLARHLGLKKQEISIISGQTQPVKLIHIAGLSPAQVLEILLP